MEENEKMQDEQRVPRAVSQNNNEIPVKKGKSDKQTASPMFMEESLQEAEDFLMLLRKD